MSNTIKVAFTSNWNKNSKWFLDRFNQQTPGNSGIWGIVEGVADAKDADYLVVWGNYAEDPKFDRSKIIQFRREPNFIEGFKAIPRSGHVIDYNDYFHASSWFVHKPFDELVNETYPDKTKKASIISSAKWKDRNRFVKKLYKSDESMSIDFYGRGIGHFIKNKGPNFKGEITSDVGYCKSSGLYDYEYTLALENSSQENYFTEKIIDCYLTWTMPIYWGCPNISDFFPDNSYYNIDISRPEDAIEIINNEIEDKHIEALTEARNLVLNKYNMWAVIEERVKEDLS